MSNAHNRLGEAEKSHQKARSKGFGEFWTIVNSVVPESVARTESPTTNRFFQLEEINDTSHAEWQRFREALARRLGLRPGPRYQRAGGRSDPRPSCKVVPLTHVSDTGFDAIGEGDSPGVWAVVAGGAGWRRGAHAGPAERGGHGRCRVHLRLHDCDRAAAGVPGRALHGGD
mgnify:CR=1 FL=1